MGWVYLYLAGGVIGFILCGYGVANTKATEKKKENRKTDIWFVVAVASIVVGGILSWMSITQMQAITICRIGTPGDLDKATFYRALSTGENLKGGKFVNVQNAVDEIFTVTSEIQPQRGAFLRVTPTGKDLEIIEPNDTSPK